MTQSSVRRPYAILALFAATLLSTLLASQPILAGSLQPPGPPAPTERTLESLGVDCPGDPANTTNLLLTFVTNQGGFDTGISISNTASDPFGTTGQIAACKIHFYGANAPAPFSTGNIAPGATFVNLASTLAPNFQGYAIVACDFAFAHGFAFISDLGARNLAMGYLAPVVCSDRRPNAMGSGR